MTINHRFHVVCEGLMPYLNIMKRLLFTAIVAALPFQAVAVTLAVQVDDGLGGRISGAPSGADCAPRCVLHAAPQSLLSLFAIADETYRFQGWNGACANTIGPLCTLRPDENLSVSARFVKTEASQAPAKALLLLHDEGAKHTVWNEFVKQRFNNRCPVVYGGVVLGEDSFDPHNEVYCYRIAFGYYDRLDPSKTASTLQTDGTGRKAKNRFAGKRLGYEVRAAVLGVLERHPNLSLTLVGQARGAMAAHSFLRVDTAERSGVVGLLALQQSSVDSKDTALRGVTFQTEYPAVLKLTAEPEQTAKISAALAQLTKSWWMTR